jgi:hypothetical protein
MEAVVTILSLAPLGNATTNRINLICGHAVQGAKVSAVNNVVVGIFSNDTCPM